MAFWSFAVSVCLLPEILLDQLESYNNKDSKEIQKDLKDSTFLEANTAVFLLKFFENGINEQIQSEDESKTI